MPKENSMLRKGEFIEKLEQIKELADRCIFEISGGSPKIRNLQHLKREAKKVTPAQVNFSLNARAFVKRHAKQLSGPKKFVLILAYLAKGQINKEISLVDIEKLWKRMKGLIGMGFNTFYAVTAKDNGWVNSPKRGIYIITDSWKGIFTHE
jgi:hypothetical protein